jgi:hypothetical protein
MEQVWPSSIRLRPDPALFSSLLTRLLSLPRDIVSDSRRRVTSASHIVGPGTFRRALCCRGERHVSCHGPALAM